MMLTAKHSKVYLCCEDEVSGSGSTRPDTNSAPESTRSSVYLAGSTRSGIVCRRHLRSFLTCIRVFSIWKMKKATNCISLKSTFRWCFFYYTSHH